MRKSCDAARTVTGVTCSLGNHPGVLHYDEAAGLWWISDEELLDRHAPPRTGWVDDSWLPEPTGPEWDEVPVPRWAETTPKPPTGTVQ